MHPNLISNLLISHFYPQCQQWICRTLLGGYHHISILELFSAFRVIHKYPNSRIKKCGRGKYPVLLVHPTSNPISPWDYHPSHHFHVIPLFPWGKVGYCYQKESTGGQNVEEHRHRQQTSSQGLINPDSGSYGLCPLLLIPLLHSVPPWSHCQMRALCREELV